MSGHRRGTEPMQPAIDSFAEAVKIDPQFARAWAALASAYLSYPSYSPKGACHLARCRGRGTLKRRNSIRR